MARITEYSNWGWWDQLDGRNLAAGELLDVTFPDGETRRVTVQIQKTNRVVSDHGHPWDCPEDRAFTMARVWGLDVRIPLLGLEAKRV